MREFEYMGYGTPIILMLLIYLLVGAWVGWGVFAFAIAKRFVEKKFAITVGIATGIVVASCTMLCKGEFMYALALCGLMFLVGYSVYKSSNFFLLYGGLALLSGLLWSMYGAIHKPTHLSYFVIFATYSIPAVLLLGEWLLLRKKLGRHRKTVAACAALSLPIGVGLISLISKCADFDFRFRIDCDPAHYKELVQPYKKYIPPFLSQFPNKIPVQATNVRFFQGATHCVYMTQLRCTLPAQEVQELLQKYMPLAKRVQNGCGQPDWQRTCVGVEFRTADNKRFGPLSEDFTVIVLHAGMDKKSDDATDWQNNYAGGIAINRTTNEVIYWATHY